MYLLKVSFLLKLCLFLVYQVNYVSATPFQRILQTNFKISIRYTLIGRGDYFLFYMIVIFGSHIYLSVSEVYFLVYLYILCDILLFKLIA